jgi:hypothetical protein
MAAFDDGSGPALYVGGSFDTAGGQPASRLAKWNGQVWSSVGPRFGTNSTSYVDALAAFDDGRGPSLWVGGNFTRIGDLESCRIARLVACRPNCYANCDVGGTGQLLNINDFMCFMNRFAAGDSYANCDGSTAPPVLNAGDFACFLGKFAAGCP